MKEGEGREGEEPTARGDFFPLPLLRPEAKEAVVSASEGGREKTAGTVTKKPSPHQSDSGRKGEEEEMGGNGRRRRERGPNFPSVSLSRSQQRYGEKKGACGCDSLAETDEA